MVTITYILIGITVLVSLWAWKNKAIYEGGLHFPYREKRNNEHWRLLTSGFLHGNQGHLLINMYMLYLFGMPVEQLFRYQRPENGSLLFLLLYISAIIVANLFTSFKNYNNPHFRSLGASGATSAILMVYILYDPWQMFLFPPLPAIIIAVGYLVYSTWASKRKNDNVDHLAHFYGAVYGLVFMAVFFPETIKLFLHKLVADFPL